ncbi:matrilysin [Phascolarctos cinereus]|uniref:Matrilysin n=1 Tax=Phascolarctos cinereus TaxID=38626 RepID=A0A6P5L4U8_PHACI|nr:matrilysin [Phascolarctos cinereus]
MRNYINIPDWISNYCTNHRAANGSFLTAIMHYYSTLCTLSLLTCCLAFPLPREAGKMNDQQWGKAQEYLKNFYSYDPEARINNLEDKIKEMQKFFGLPQTGILNTNTMEIIQKPRCGVPDVGEYSFFPERPKWLSKVVTYRVVSYTEDMPRSTVDHLVEKALDMWSKASTLTFKKVRNGNADIIIGFARGVHGDFSPFDGPGGILAHAFAPGTGIGGDAHFDNDEQWSDGSKIGINFLFTATHELGHSLGLGHSSDPEAVMYPTYSYKNPEDFSLSEDDIRGIQKLYGKRR